MAADHRCAFDLFAECKREVQSNANEEIDSAYKRGNHKTRRTRRYTESWTESSPNHQGCGPQGVSAAAKETLFSLFVYLIGGEYIFQIKRS